MDWKNLFYAFLGFVLPLVFDEIVKADPNFPLLSQDFVNLVLHLIGYLMGGWNIALVAVKRAKAKGVL